jgi:hypothetical protein
MGLIAKIRPIAAVGVGQRRLEVGRNTPSIATAGNMPSTTTLRANPTNIYSLESKAASQRYLFQTLAIGTLQPEWKLATTL